MNGKFVITDDPYQAITPIAADEVGLSEIEKQGLSVFVDKGCVACHSRDGSRTVGPSFQHLWGRHEDLEGGGGATVDEAYFKESVREPGAKIVKGFQPVMPQLMVSDDELQKLIAYAKKL